MGWKFEVLIVFKESTNNNLGGLKETYWILIWGTWCTASSCTVLYGTVQVGAPMYLMLVVLILQVLATHTHTHFREYTSKGIGRQGIHPVPRIRIQQLSLRPPILLLLDSLNTIETSNFHPKLSPSNS